MKENLKEQFPLEFKNLNKVRKYQKKNQIKFYTEVDFYKSNKIHPELFFKHISKIISFDI
jgi:hypothetical protein